MLHNIIAGNVDKEIVSVPGVYMEIIIAGIIVGVAAAAAIKTAPVMKPAPIRVKK
jgi:hypothetical protein